MTLLDGSMQFNVNLFHMSIEGLQAAARQRDAIGLATFSVINAADTTSQGLEMDLAWNVNDWLTIGGNYAYTDATYDSYPGSESCPVGAVQAADGTCDLAGFTLPFAPENKGSVYADVFLPDAVGDWGVKLHGDVNYSSEAFSNDTFLSTEVIDSRTLVNASVSFVSPSEKYLASIVVRNLTDETYCVWCLDGGPASLNTPREILFRFSAKFD